MDKPTSIPTRQGLGRVLLLAAACAAAGCPGESGTRPAPGIAKGPRLRQRPGQERSPARLVLEVDPRRKPVGPATLHTFNLTIEETVLASDDTGANVEAHLIDVVGASGMPKLSDQIALALDDLKLTFRRTDRGAVRDLKIDGLHEPLDEPTVRAIAFTLFGVGRGPRLPDHDVELKDDWTIDADTELVGIVAHLRHYYTLVARQHDEIEIRCKGHIEGAATVSGSQRRVEGDTFADETLDLYHGTVLSGEYELTTLVEDDPPLNENPGMGRTHVRAERGRAAQPKKK